VTISKLQTEIKEEQTNLMINGKNYWSERRRNYCYYGNGESCWRNIYIPL